MENKGRKDFYLLRFEESFGYLSGTYVRDKDGVNGAFLICEMFAYYKNLGIGLYEKLEELYQKYGYCLNTLHSITFEGVAGKQKMQKIMNRLRQGLEHFGEKQILDCQDYAEGRDGLPKADVLKFIPESNCSVVARPSGTEPKMKIYIFVTGADRAVAIDRERGERILPEP